MRAVQRGPTRVVAVRRGLPHPVLDRAAAALVVLALTAPNRVEDDRARPRSCACRSRRWCSCGRAGRCRRGSRGCGRFSPSPPGRARPGRRREGARHGLLLRAEPLLRPVDRLDVRRFAGRPAPRLLRHRGRRRSCSCSPAPSSSRSSCSRPSPCDASRGSRPGTARVPPAVVALAVVWCPGRARPPLEQGGRSQPRTPPTTPTRR